MFDKLTDKSWTKKKLTKRNIQGYGKNVSRKEHGVLVLKKKKHWGIQDGEWEGNTYPMALSIQQVTN